MWDGLIQGFSSLESCLLSTPLCRWLMWVDLEAPEIVSLGVTISYKQQPPGEA